jgi:hypothetical protein
MTSESKQPLDPRARLEIWVGNLILLSDTSGPYPTYPTVLMSATFCVRARRYVEHPFLWHVRIYLHT